MNIEQTNAKPLDLDEDNFNDFLYGNDFLCEDYQNMSNKNECSIIKQITTLESDLVSIKEPIENEVFLNYTLKSSDGHFLGYLTKQRLKWHIKKNYYLSIDETNNIVVLDQTFQEVQDKKKTYIKQHYSIKKENLCISCGTTFDLVKMRIIPYCITKLIPDEHKTGAENIIAICLDCSIPISKLLNDFKKDIYQKYCIDINELEKTEKLLNNYKTASLYLKNPEIFSTKSKSKFKRLLYNKIRSYNKKTTITNMDIKQFIDNIKEKFSEEYLEANFNGDLVNKELVSKIFSFSDFKKEWIEFFFENVNINYMTDEVRNYLKSY
jgi:hypothetical protein